MNQLNLIEPYTHYELCKLTAEWAMKKFRGQACVYEYQSFATSEFPDVLLYGSYSETTLFEVKVDYQDFKRDKHKDSRVKWKSRWHMSVHKDPKTKKFVQNFKTYNPELYYIEQPHLGKRRYYVCQHGLIQPSDIPDGWGLYWVNGGKFRLKKESGNWRSNVHEECSIAVHALRKYANNDTSNILVQMFD